MAWDPDATCIQIQCNCYQVTVLCSCGLRHDSQHCVYTNSLCLLIKAMHSFTLYLYHIIFQETTSTNTPRKKTSPIHDSSALKHIGGSSTRFSRASRCMLVFSSRVEQYRAT